MASSKKPTNPDEAALRDLGLSFPEVTEDFPWGHRALKVKGKVFVFMGTGKAGGADHDDFFISCKLPQSSQMALMLPEVKPTGYGLGKAGWVSARYKPGEAPVDMLQDWLRESYCAVAPKRLAMLLEGAGSASAVTSGRLRSVKGTSGGKKSSGAKKTSGGKKSSGAKKTSGGKKTSGAKKRGSATARIRTVEPR